MHPQPIHIAHATIYMAPPPDLLPLQVAGIATDAARSAPPSAASTLTPPAPGEHWPGQGGIYICTLPAMLGLPARHLVASTAEVELEWGGYDHDTPGAASHTDGPANTRALLADNKEHPAATWAAAYTADGHKDFHLPARFDLLMAYLHAPQVFEKQGWYWSSTQTSRYCAFVQVFEFGDSHASHKGCSYRVRAVRWIQP